MFKSGFVTIIGRPNVGKSTLMNRLVGEKIAITSNKPQTTRNKIKTVLTDKEAQIVFMDTPGIHKPKNELGKFMNEEVDFALEEMDVVIMITDESSKIGPGDEYIIDKIKGSKAKKILLINKIDKRTPIEVASIYNMFNDLDVFDEIIQISALKDMGITTLIRIMKSFLPEGPMLYPEDYLTDRPEKWVVAEIIREKALQYLDDEVPHGIAVEIEKMKKRPNKDMMDISAVILCEKKSHKSIVIGKGGRKLKGIGKSARIDIEELVGYPVFLQLWVKVSPNWRDNDNLLKSLGYENKQNI